MSQSDQFDNYNNGNEENGRFSDAYTSESSADIYNTPDITGSPLNDTSSSGNIEETVEGTGTEENVPLEVISEADTMIEDVVSENTATVEFPAPSDNSYNSNPYDNITDGSRQYVSRNMPDSSPYHNSPYGSNPYNNNSYGNNSYNGNSYGINPYGGQKGTNGEPYNNNPYTGNSYGNNPYSGNSYGGNPYGGQNGTSGEPYNNIPYGNTPYSGQNGSPYNHNPYANGANGRQAAQNNTWTGNNPPYPNNQYGSYAAPPQKNNTGLIIGIVVAVIALFLIVVGALTYMAISLYAENKNKTRNSREEYDFDDDWKTDHNDRNSGVRPDDSYDYDDYDDYDDWFNDYDYDYDYDYDDGYDQDDRYYDLHDEIRNDLSYSVDMEYYEYDTDYENVSILITYPVIKGANVPNLDKLNGTIKDEVDFITEYFEEEYKDYMIADDSYFSALSTGYVTYMDEEKLSVVFSEYIYSDYYDDVFLYSINIDMENGVVMDNENIINANDDFSVDFRKRSDIQNGEISYLTMMTDQEMTKYFNSSDIIIFYTPKGMEIGFNYEAGWVTVTYEDYEQYLKVF